MTVQTYTPDSLITIALPGDLPGLLDGWVGRVEIVERGTVDWTVATRTCASWYAVTNGPNEGRVEAECWARSVRLPLARWEARARVVAWLAAGEQCFSCFGRGTKASPPHRSPDCARCNATGYLRAPADLRWALDWPGLPGTLPAWQSAAILHASALRAAAGMGAVVAAEHVERHVNTRRFIGAYCGATLYWCHTREDADYFVDPYGEHHGWCWSGQRGLDVGDEAMRIVDTLALNTGYALLDDDALIVEVPSEALAAEGGR